MKAKLGPNIVLRLKFSQQAQGEEIGDGKGYQVVATSDEADNLALEMVDVNAHSGVEVSAAPADAPEATPLMTKDSVATEAPASTESLSEAPAGSDE